MSDRRKSRSTTTAALAVALLALAGTARAEPARVDCRVVYQTADGIYVDVGASAGLEEGTRAWLERDGARLARVEVARIGDDSVLLRLRETTSESSPRVGDRVTLLFERVETPARAAREASPTLRDQTAEATPFVPLLANPDLGDEATTEARDVFHGRISARQLFQVTTDGDQDFSLSRVDVSGSIDRIAGTPWLFEWSGSAQYRAGAGYENVRDSDSLRVEVYRASLFRRFEDRSFVRLGRFVPLELPGVGWIDGVQGEKALSDTLRLGGMLGFKPDREDVDPNLEELQFVPYVTWQGIDSDDTSWSTTTGLLATLYEGEPDRMALMTDQVARWRDLSVFATSVVDFDVGGAEARSGDVRWTHLDVLATWSLHGLFEPRLGVDRFELPDTRAWRDSFDPGALDATDLFFDSYWRYLAGASHELPGGLRLSEEVIWLDSELQEGLRWNVSLTRRGLPGLPDGSVTLTVYDLEGVRTEGYGGRLAAQVPLLDGRLLLLPSVGVRWADYETVGENFFLPVADDLLVVDASVRAYWRIEGGWRLDGGIAATLFDEEQRYLIDVALTYEF